MDEKEEIKRPIYLGDLIIGYEAVTSRTRNQTKEESNPRQRMAKRKARELMKANTEPDLTPIVIPQKNVVVRDHNGKKRRLDLLKISQAEADNDIPEDEIWKRIKLLKEQEIEGSGSEESSDCEILEERSPSSVPEVEEATVHLKPEVTEEPKVILKVEEEKLGDKNSACEIENNQNKLTLPESNETSENLSGNTDTIMIPVTTDNNFVNVITEYSKTQPDKCDETGIIKEGHITLHNNALLPLTPDSLEETSPHEETIISFIENDDDDECHSILVLDKPKNPGSCMATLTASKTAHQTEAVTPMDICNICGQGIKSRADASTYLELSDNNLKYFICLTCNQKFSLIELTRHKSNCFLTEEEFGFDYEDGKSGEEVRNKKEVKLRMVACKACIEYVQNCDDTIKS